MLLLKANIQTDTIANTMKNGYIPETVIFLICTYQTVAGSLTLYAVSIHKAQGLEYDSVKIVITDEVEELVTHNIFYTAITRAREKLKIYWTPEVEEKVINRIRPRDISKDVELLKNYLTEKQQEESFDFWL